LIMKKILIIVLVTVLALGLIGCGKNNDNEKIGIRGVISDLSRSQDNKVTFILVEGNLESDTMYDKASIAITDKTKIIKKATQKKFLMDDLKEGVQVEVLLEGPVRESYPVQADAKEVRVLD
jgi:beta-N-acetylhexosaminidase